MVAAPAVVNVPNATAKGRMALLRGIHAQYEVPGVDGIFESTCFKLFKVEMLRELTEEVLPSADDLEAYQNWEEQAVEKADLLPLLLSEWVYNYAQVHEHTAIGREGLPIPKEETRKVYRNLACSYWNFCRNKQEPWVSLGGTFGDCWIRFLTTPTVADQAKRSESIGLFVRHRLSGNRCRLCCE